MNTGINRQKQRHHGGDSKNHLNAYLDNYGEPEAQSASRLLEKTGLAYPHVLCLPCYDEATHDVAQLIQFCHQHQALPIIVINQPDRIAQPSAANRTLYDDLSAQGCSQQADNVALITTASDNHIVVVNRFSPDRPVPASQGVGLARKIAGDIAMAFIRSGVVSGNWIHCTDADVTLPDDYFDAATSYANTDTAALIYPYQHRNTHRVEPSVVEATEIYEQHLCHYVKGLRYAGSPYAYQTLGSTLCVSARHMAMVRGFPARAGGEDFYLLNKLRKVGEVVSLSQPLLSIAMRLSHRVPFGTGPAVGRLSGLEQSHNGTPLLSNAQQQKLFYHPALFEPLKLVLMWFRILSVELTKKTKEAGDWPTLLANFVESTDWVDKPSIDTTTMIDALKVLGFQRCVDHCKRQCKTTRQVEQHINCWFDAFRTLRFLHTLRNSNSELSNLNWYEFSEYYRHENFIPGGFNSV